MVDPVDLEPAQGIQSAFDDLPCSVKYVSTEQCLHSVSPLPS